MTKTARVTLYAIIALVTMVVSSACSGSPGKSAPGPVSPLSGQSPLTGVQPGPPVSASSGGPLSGPSQSAGRTPAPNHPTATPGHIPPPATPNGTLHFIANVGGQVPAVRALGFNLIDTGPDPETVDALPSGVRALVWLGSLDNHDCDNPSYTFDQFTAAVDKLVGNPKVFGYFLADEPHPKDCPKTAADLRQRADYVRTHDPSHLSFVVVLDGTNQCNGSYVCVFAALAPSKTHVDLIGLDPYPCNTSNITSGCEYSKISSTVQHATSNGIPKSAIVPVFQAFGQACAASDYYRLPSASELQKMLALWHSLVATPAFDYTYTWSRQGSACPALVDADGTGAYPDLQAVIRHHNVSGP